MFFGSLKIFFFLSFFAAKKNYAYNFVNKKTINNLDQQFYYVHNKKWQIYQSDDKKKNARSNFKIQITYVQKNVGSGAVFINSNFKFKFQTFPLTPTFHIYTFHPTLSKLNP